MAFLCKLLAKTKGLGYHAQPILMIESDHELISLRSSAPP